MTKRGFLLGATIAGVLAGWVAACGGGVDSNPFTSTSSTSTGHGGGSTSTGTGTSTGTATCDCDDGIACTVDSCAGGTCTHVPGNTCPAGQFCEVHTGCTPGEVCATTAQCVTKLGGDPCKVDITCDPAQSICTFSILDKDGDGHPPVVCGGDDCDDSDGTKYPGAPELCDGKDNDCDGTADDGATCPGLGTCQAGVCTCPPANACGTECVDKQTDPNHCGDCATKCPSAATCTAGKCVCAAGATVCGTACVDLKTDPANCNGCGQACAPGYACQNGSCLCNKTSCGGACVDTQTDPAHCGTCTTVCPAGLSCNAGQCACTGKICNGACIDTSSDENNCGNCGTVCPAGNVCQGGQCVGCPQADLYVLLDLSASMNGTGTVGTNVRLDFAKSGINGFAADTANAGLGLGLGYFPVQNASCSAAAYTPAVPIAALPGNAAPIQTSLASAVLSTSSTQAPALQGALTAMKTYIQAHTNHKGAVVLITDGLPDACTTPGVATDVANIAAAFASGTPAVKTYVVGLATDVPRSSWDAIAAAGGTGKATVLDSTTQWGDVASALEGIKMTFSNCQSPGPCAHDECTTPGQLAVGCSPCVTAVCQHDVFCCTQDWDQICTGEVATYCAPKTCP